MKVFLLFFLCNMGTLCSKSQATVAEQARSVDLYAGSFSTVYEKRISINPSVFGYAGSFYFENRYNYEAANSASVNAGIKLFRKIKPLSVIPMIGIVVGNFKAATTELQTSITIKNWLISSDNQFSIGYAKPKNNLYLNWSVLRYRIFKGFEIGGTSSFQKQSAGKSVLDPGLTIALTIHEWYLRFYNYYPDGAKQYYWLALRYHLHFNIGR